MNPYLHRVVVLYPSLDLAHPSRDLMTNDACMAFSSIS